ncbi:MAG: glycosyltransferase [Thaumarchaeota archaeon]|nr:glycosyltransferase [Nitrososphaerota archaeon]
MDFVTVINYVIITIVCATSLTWLYFIYVMRMFLTRASQLDKFEKKNNNCPKVSVIVPARNEEKFISKCLQSLLDQDYNNLEVIAINDSSFDNTDTIIKKFSKINSKIIYVNAKNKPNGWIGKNWACVEGYKKSSGELILFTDADTTYHKTTISLSVSHLLSSHLDALTVIPKISCLDVWTKITLPILSIFLHTRFSSIKVNDPKQKTGYFFGSFFIIKKNIYESIGTHKNVKHEIVEDGALGRIMKESGYKIKMVRGEKFIESIWSRDITTLWNGLKRLIIPLNIQSKYYTFSIFIAMLFLLLMPNLFLIYSSMYLHASVEMIILFIISLLTLFLIHSAILIELKTIELKSVYCICTYIGTLIILSSFLYVLLKKEKSLSWKKREYSKQDLMKSTI